MNIVNGFIFSEYKLHHRSSIGIWKYWDFQREAKAEQIIAIVTTHSVSCLKLKIICSQNTAEKLSQLKFFPANMFLFGVRKNNCTAPFPDAQELLSWNTLKANVCIFLYVSLRTFCFKDLARFYLVVWRVGGGWILSLRRLAVWFS